jgi:hypothetical protein
VGLGLLIQAWSAPASNLLDRKRFTMSLVLKAGPEANDDYHVMHGELKVGQIYNAKPLSEPRRNGCGRLTACRPLLMRQP